MPNLTPRPTDRATERSSDRQMKFVQLIGGPQGPTITARPSYIFYVKIESYASTGQKTLTFVAPGQMRSPHMDRSYDSINTRKRACACSESQRSYSKPRRQVPQFWRTPSFPLRAPYSSFPLKVPYKQKIHLFGIFL